jgi:gliding motility-associated-like protein
MKKILSILSLFISLNAVGQGEAANWFFGHGAGIEFDRNSDIVSPVDGGQLDTFEGCATISDIDGNLLFYTDGISVWNKNHFIMQNGTALHGDPSSSQAAIIVPKPNDPDIYYIFTVDVQFQNENSHHGFSYSVVDMSQAGGLGAVTAEKNIKLLNYSSEKITAVLKDCVDKSIWVVTLGTENGDFPNVGNSGFFDTYFAFEVSSLGVNASPVKSTFSDLTIGDQRGYLKLSPDGKKMASANMNGGLYIYDFDEDTGIISNQERLFINTDSSAPYGIEFSPNNELLYVHSHNGQGAGSPPENHVSSLTQFDLTVADIQSSEFTIDERQLYRGALQLGPDGRIYRALSANYQIGLSSLGVINNPNARGSACDYLHSAINLSPNTSSQGLPPFLQSIFNRQIDIIQNGESSSNLNLCDGDTYTLAADDLPGATYIWSLDGSPLPKTDFDLDISQGGHYELFIDPNNGDCPIEGEAFVNYFSVPIGNKPDNIDICDDDNDGVFAFDFTSNVNAQVLNGQDPTLFEIHYFENETDALNNTNEISMPYENSSNPKEIFVLIQNNGNENCFDLTSFNIEVFNTPIANTVSNQTPPSTIFSVCDDISDGDNMNGQTTIEFQDLDSLVLIDQDPSLYSITYHRSQMNADTGTAALPISYYNQTPYLEVIYVRIENIAYPECYDTTSFDLVIDIAPEAFDQSLVQCDEDGLKDGFTIFNLTEAHEAITGGAANRSTKFFLNQADAQNDTGEIDSNAFSNTTNPQTIYVRVINDNTGCVNFAELTLEVSLTNARDASLFACDDDGTEDGFYHFVLSDATSDVLSGAPSDVSVDYYESYNDALLEIDPLPEVYMNTVPYNHTIFVRVENDNACYGINEVELTVYELPDLVTEDENFYCLNLFPQTITLTGGIINDLPSNYTYLWSTGETMADIQVNQPGTYSVTVTNGNGCSKNRSITVTPSNIATFQSIDVVDVSQNNTVTVFVSGEGEYSFTLDDPNGPYQDSNFFENVAPGIHTVYVRDNKNNCGIVDQLVSVIGFPKFFTPNNDSYNDTWQVYGLAEQFQPNTKIYIYDRYGKLVKQLDPLGPGWNGTYNGQGLPSNDYWFEVALQDGRIFKGHFSLKR